MIRGGCGRTSREVRECSAANMVVIVLAAAVVALVWVLA